MPIVYVVFSMDYISVSVRQRLLTDTVVCSFTSMSDVGCLVCEGRMPHSQASPMFVCFRFVFRIAKTRKWRIKNAGGLGMGLKVCAVSSIESVVCKGWVMWFCCISWKTAQQVKWCKSCIVCFSVVALLHWFFIPSFTYCIPKLTHHFRFATEKHRLSYLDFLGNHTVSEHMVCGERSAISPSFKCKFT